MKDRLMTKYEVMEYLSISRQMFEKLVREEGLPMIKITQNKRYVRLSQLNEFLNNRMINEKSEKKESVLRLKEIFK